MTKVPVKHNKKEEQKKLAVRVICLALAVVLVVTSLLAVLPSLFGSNIDPELQAMIDAGYVYQAEDGNFYYTDEYIEMWTAAMAEAENLSTEAEESHEGHEHE